MPKLSLTKVGRHLFSASDGPRQKVLGAATYKDHISNLLFLNAAPTYGEVSEN
jgi:hypothetical protein